LHIVTAAVGELEACKLQHLATIEDLNTELVTVKQRLAEVEQNKQTLEADLRLKSSADSLGLRSLEKVN